MGRVMFYHLTQSTPEALVPQLIRRAQDAGWRVELRGSDADSLARLDERLWLAEGFLAHGMAGGPHDADQPVLLRQVARDTGGSDDGSPPPANGAACILSLDGAAVPVAPSAGIARICILFDGRDPAALEVARGQWRAVVAAGLVAEYWSEASGRWRKERASKAG